MAALVSSSKLNELALVAHDKVIEERGAAMALDRAQRPWMQHLDKIKKPLTRIGDNTKHQHMTDVDLDIQWVSGDPVISHQELFVGRDIEFGWARGIAAVKFEHERMQKMGIQILPNTTGGHQERIADIGRDDTNRLFNYLVSKIDAIYDSREAKTDRAWHRSGSTPEEPDGLFALLPGQLTGVFGGHDRSSAPELQHCVYAGAGVPAGSPAHIGAGGSVSAGHALNGLVPTLETAMRQATMYNSNNGVPGTIDLILAGSRAIDRIKAWYRANGAQHPEPMKHDGMLDVGIAEVSIMRRNVVWDPTLDYLDMAHSGDQMLPVSDGVITITGGGGSGAFAMAYATAAGAIDSVLVTQGGSGYTTPPSVALSGLGGGTGATFQAWIYSTSTGTGYVTVDGDDTRIGKIAKIEVTAGGSGYTAAVPMQFKDLIVGINTKTLEFCNQPGLDWSDSMPADPHTGRSSYLHLDGLHQLALKAPRSNFLVETRD